MPPTPRVIKPAAAAAGGEDADGQKYPTPAEAYVFFSVVKHIKGRPDIDWDGVAKDCGFKNAETAKVRYGQIKRKLGIETWDYSKKKNNETYEEASYSASPSTPATGRTRKVPATPGTGTGAGVKKRASAVSKRPTATPTRAGRQAKSQAIIKMEEAEQAFENIDHEDEEADEEMQVCETPTKKTGGLLGNAYIKKEPGTNSATAHYGIASTYATFPAVMPDVVLERKAILVNLNGSWTVSPTSFDIHAQWLSHLPANIQSEFYAQAQHMANNATNTAANASAASAPNNGYHNNNNNNNNNNHHPPNHHSAAYQVMPTNNNNHNHNIDARQLAQQIFPDIAMSIPTGMAIEMGFMAAPPNSAAALSAAANQSGGGYDGLPRDRGNVDMSSIPMHTSYLENQRGHEAREREEREQEERDRALLFEGLSD